MFSDNSGCHRSCVNTESDLPERESHISLYLHHFIHISLEFKRGKAHIDGMCEIDIRKAAGAHIGIADCFQFFQAVSYHNFIKLCETSVQLLYQLIGRHSFGDLCKTDKIREHD